MKNDKPEKTEVLHLRLTVPLVRRVDAVAKAQDRTRAYIIAKAIEAWLEKR